MAWLINIGPPGALVDRTSTISLDAGVDISLTYNERSMARFSTLPGYRPSLRDEVYIYEQDGVTLLFGGLVYQRQTQSVIDRVTTQIDCADWSIYGDWAYTDAVYSAATTLQVVLNDLVTILAPYGVTLDATDYTGVALSAFAWSNKSITDALRDLSTKTGYIWKFSPTKVLSLILPGATPAPFNLSDATPHCSTLEWFDSTEKYATKVRLECGPEGTAWTLQTWTQSGGATSWVTDLPAAGPTAGYCTVGGIFLTVTSVVGDSAHFNWNIATHTLSVGALGSTPANGTVITLSYLSQTPFTVIADSLASPVVEYLASAPDVMTIAAGQEMADGLLARLGGTQKSIEFMTLESGLEPGQELSIVLADRHINVASAFIQTVQIRLVMATWWEYRVLAIEGSDYLGSYLDFWRRTDGGGSGTAVLGSASGTVTVGGSPSPVYLGGSRFHAVQMGD